MKKAFYSFMLLSIGVQFSMCKPAHSTLSIHKLRNYNPSAASHLLFLNFRISRANNASSEKVELINSISGSGKMKDLGVKISNPICIKVIQHFTDGRNPVETSYEHPLLGSVEVPDPSGKMARSVLNTKEAIFSVRIQEDKSMDEIELYSVTPDKGSVKIYSLRLKP